MVHVFVVDCLDVWVARVWYSLKSNPEGPPGMVASGLMRGRLPKFLALPPGGPACTFPEEPIGEVR